MTDENWVKIRSWHAVRTFTRAIGGSITACGRNVVSTDYRNEVPWDGKSCEVCLRIRERQS